MYKKLFIPGPTHVEDEILKAMAVPMIGHRDCLYSDLHGEVVTKLKEIPQNRWPDLSFFLLIQRHDGRINPESGQQKSPDDGLRGIFQTLG